MNAEMAEVVEMAEMSEDLQNNNEESQLSPGAPDEAPRIDRTDWGFDPPTFDAMVRLAQVLYQRYWRVDARGLEHIPAQGSAMLVPNHSGQFPFDAIMIATAVYTQHPQKRLVRNLYGTWFARLPFAALMLNRLGQVLSSEENILRLLEQDEVVAVFPEGYKGIAKLYAQRYQLARFGRGGFARVALATGTPVIPVAVVGAEETYIALANLSIAEKVFGYPMPPLTPTWPWLGLLGAIPLPTKWTIEFGAPIETSGCPPGADQNPVLIAQLSDQVRNTIQLMLYRRLAERRSIFFG